MTSNLKWASLTLAAWVLLQLLCSAVLLAVLSIESFWLAMFGHPLLWSLTPERGLGLLAWTAATAVLLFFVGVYSRAEKATEAAALAKAAQEAREVRE